MCVCVCVCMRVCLCCTEEQTEKLIYSQCESECVIETQRSEAKISSWSRVCIQIFIFVLCTFEYYQLQLKYPPSTPYPSPHQDTKTASGPWTMSPLPLSMLHMTWTNSALSLQPSVQERSRWSSYRRSEHLNWHQSVAGRRAQLSTAAGSSVYVPVNTCQFSICECIKCFYLFGFYVCLSFADRKELT